jgi:hypothetical protein
MPGLDGKGPTGEGRPGRGLGRCGKAKQGQRSDIQPRPEIKGETDTNMDRGAGNGGGRGRGRSRGHGRMQSGRLREKARTRNGEETIGSEYQT